MGREKIIGFYHVATMNHWKDVFDEQVDLIHRSGLASACDRILVGKVGQERCPSLPAKFELAYEGDLKEYEYPTLELIFRYSKRCKFQAFYIHTKGVSHSHENWEFRKKNWFALKDVESPEALHRNETQWRRFLNHFVIRRWSQCSNSLNSFQVAGANWRETPPHFSGNFWWSRSDYIARLNSPTQFGRELHTLRPGLGERVGAEYWIGFGDPMVRDFKTATHNFYRWGCPPWHYLPIHL